MNNKMNKQNKQPMIKSVSNEQMYDENLIEPNIKFIRIQKSYLENKSRNYQTNNVLDYEDKIKFRNYYSSLFEVLSPFKPLKPYFDIEKIPIDQPNLIYNIIDNLQTWFNKETGDELGEYILTHNKHSVSHDGLSYHLIFYERMAYQSEILNMLNNFLEIHPEYTTFMDGSVYSKDRLFRSVNQIGVDKKNNCLSPHKDDIHIIVNKKQNDESIAQSIIQNTKNCTLIKHEFKSIKRPRSKHISYYSKTKPIQPTIIIHNHINKEDDKYVPTNDPNKINIDNEIYCKTFALNLKRDQLNDYVKEYINELLEYYNQNKTFDGYKQTKEQILIILKMLA